jgi:hypothetical protein
LHIGGGQIEGDMTDRRGYQDAANVAFTQTGAMNVKASARKRSSSP